MRILHLHWQPPTSPAQTGALFLWAEDASISGPFETIDRRKQSVRPHPFALSGPGIKAAWQRLTGIDPSGKSGEIILRLLTGRFGPLPSPRLIHNWESDESKPLLRSWEIPALALDPADAFFLLSRLPGGENLPHDIVLGDDLLLWQAATRLAMEAVAQQKLLPGVVADQSGKVLYARWSPVLDSPRDGPRLARLSQAMPPLCRAGEAVDGQELPPRFLLDSFLSSTVDGLVRRWCTAPKAATSDTTTQQWLAALHGDFAQLNLSAAERPRFLKSYQSWLRNLHVAGDAHFRVALRLESPEEEGKEQRWMLHFLLQSRADPSLLIDAREIWRTRGSILAYLDHRLENPQELLLTGLGFAARHSEPIRQSLQARNPTHASFTPDEAFAFLRETAPLLEESGFGVLVPPWWHKANAHLGLRLKMKGQSQVSDGGVARGLVSMENLVRYNWQLSIADQELSWEEFQTLVALKSPLVKIRGQWVRLDPEQIEAAIRFWERQQTEQEIGLLEAATLALGGAEVDGLPVESVEAEGWLHDWLARFKGEAELEMLDRPAGLQATLRPYQVYGYSWLDFQRRWGVGACLADDMGLGKTIQTLSMIQRMREEQGSDGLAPILLIAPTSVVVNWARESARFTPDLRVMVHQGSGRLQGEEFVAEAANHDLVATSYALVRRDGEFLKQVAWSGIVLDEAQNIKNPGTKQARTIRQLPGDFRMALTGTPVENRLSELWSIMHFLNPGFLGSREQFRKHYSLPIERYDDEVAAARLRRIISPFILRRVKTDPTVIQDLPDKQENKAYCYLSQEQATLYQAVVEDALATIESAEDEMKRRGLVLSMLMKLKQICNHPDHFLHQLEEAPLAEERIDRSGKLVRLVELLDEVLDAGDRALIFTQFTEIGGFLHKFLQQRFGRPALFLHGGTPARQRQQMVDRFQEPGGPPIFVLSLKAGGTGLNLTRASYVFHFDRWWNPAVEDQATDRAFRIGQKQNVQVHKFVCVGTLEEKIDAMIDEKRALARSVIGSGENWLTELTTSDLREMVKLSVESVGG
jgi:SNF2 family DNA or RNA helicase